MKYCSSCWKFRESVSPILAAGNIIITPRFTTIYWNGILIGCNKRIVPDSNYCINMSL